MRVKVLSFVVVCCLLLLRSVLVFFERISIKVETKTRTKLNEEKKRRFFFFFLCKRRVNDEKVLLFFLKEKFEGKFDEKATTL